MLITFLPVVGSGRTRQVHAFAAGLSVSVCGRAILTHAAEPEPASRLSCTLCKARLRDFPPEKCVVQVSTGVAVEAVALAFQEKRVQVAIGGELKWVPHSVVRLSSEV